MKRRPPSARGQPGRPRASRPEPEPAADDGPFRLPRARLAVPFRLCIGEGADTRFSARLPSRDLSVSGAFLESSFFLPVGTRLRVSFQVDEDAPPLEASAEIVRNQPPGEGGDGAEGGFALRFFEFHGAARVAITELVLGEQLRDFTARYRKSRRAAALETDEERWVDLIASWELFKATGK